MYTKPPSPSTGADAWRDDGMRQSAHAAVNSHMVEITPASLEYPRTWMMRK